MRPPRRWMFDGMSMHLAREEPPKCKTAAAAAAIPGTPPSRHTQSDGPVLVATPNGARPLTPHDGRPSAQPPTPAAARDRPGSLCAVLVVTRHRVRLVTPQGVRREEGGSLPPNHPPQLQEPAPLLFWDRKRLQRVPPLKGNEGFSEDTDSSRAKRRQRHRSHRHRSRPHHH
ncbi:unnamed protein product [Vitrella brassicaformis CCMP3155]|uniref:Uncharacterized protein n=1 Tax=Vitrella brassicaformis (strain CCMP3155) TaxID=1169540 RepID=A0A0G4G2Q9_VITBC|nr:unnamed protein product [Vitrella brassicaformis CCMP3155]|eukprot:CEM22554.1 unnamed protein product [Vitrella brassicaformis CCMP3155]